MPLLLPPLSDADVPVYQTLRRAVSAEGGFLSLMYNGEPTAEQTASDNARMLEAIHDDPTVRVFKVSDTITGEMVSFAKWNVYDPPKSRADWEQEARERQVPSGANVALATEFLARLYESRKQHLSGIPCIFLHNLLTHPAHQRRGAGSLVLQWGADEADRRGLVSYLEASTMGQSLYRRFGFEQVDEICIDLRPYGGSGVEYHAVMARKPRPRN